MDLPGKFVGEDEQEILDEDVINNCRKLMEKHIESDEGHRWRAIKLMELACTRNNRFEYIVRARVLWGDSEDAETSIELLCRDTDGNFGVAGFVDD